MKSVLFKKIFLGVVCSIIAVVGAISPYAFSFEKSTIAKATTYYTLNGEEVRIEVYQRARNEDIDAPTFAVGETVMKAIEYKKANITEDVFVDFAIYRFHPDTAVYYKPNTVNYGKMTKLEEDETADCIRIAYTFVKAAMWGIKTNVLVHKESGTGVVPYLNQFLDEPCLHDSSKKVKEYLTARQCQWINNGTSHQMHSKQLLVSDYIDHDGKEYHNAVWTSTANVDQHTAFDKKVVSWKNWFHSGFMVSNNTELYRQNKLFFDITFDHYADRELFIEEVLIQKALGNLKYEDDYLEFYFTPVANEYSDGWNVADNPVAKYFDRLANCKGDFAVYINMYAMGDSAYFDRILQSIETAFANNPDAEGICDVVVNNEGSGLDETIANRLNAVGDITVGKQTHAKNFAFYFGDTDEYVCITGSTNLSEGELFLKSNQTGVLKEKGDKHPIFDTFVDYHLKNKVSK